MARPLRTRRQSAGGSTALAGGSVAVLALFVSACSGVDHAEVSDPTAVLDAYFAPCPETPVFDRSLRFVADDEAFPTPEAAVRSVAGVEVEVLEVNADGRSSEVGVRSEGEVGTFYLWRRAAGWLVRGGEGCAAWPSARKIVGDHSDDYVLTEQIQVDSN